MFDRLFGRKRQANRAIIERLYEQIVAAARQPVLYAEWSAPDTPLGRFEMIAMHVFLVLRRLKDQPAAREVAQDLTDTFFADVDQSLRTLGIGDLGIPKRMKKLARMFYGRTASYSEAIDRHDVSALAEAITRNTRPGEECDKGAERMAHYVMLAAAALDEQPIAEIASGVLRFPHPSSIEEPAT